MMNRREFLTGIIGAASPWVLSGCTAGEKSNSIGRSPTVEPTAKVSAQDILSFLIRDYYPEADAYLREGKTSTFPIETPNTVINHTEVSINPDAVEEWMYFLKNLENKIEVSEIVPNYKGVLFPRAPLNHQYFFLLTPRDLLPKGVPVERKENFLLAEMPRENYSLSYIVLEDKNDAEALQTNAERLATALCDTEVTMRFSKDGFLLPSDKSRKPLENVARRRMCVSLGIAYGLRHHDFAQYQATLDRINEFFPNPYQRRLYLPESIFSQIPKRNMIIGATTPH